MLFSVLKDIVKHSSIYGLTILLSSILSVILLPIYTHYLSTADYGVLSIVDFGSELIKILCLFGMQVALPRFYCLYKDNADKSSVAWASFIIVFFISSIFSIILFSYSSYIARLLLGKNKFFITIIYIVCIMLLFSGLYRICMTFFQVKKFSKYYSIVTIIQLILCSSISIYLLIYRHYGVMAVLFGELLSIIICFMLSFYVFYIYNKVFNINKIFLHIPTLLKFGFPLAPALILAMMVHNIDQYVLRFFKGLSDVGIYSIAYKFPFMLNSLLLTSLDSIWQQSTIYEIENNDDSKFIYSRIATYFMLIYIYMMYLLSLFSKDILHILVSSKFYSASSIIPILCIGFVPYAFTSFITISIKIANNTLILLYIFALVTILNISLNIYIIPSFGYIGAAWTSVITYSFFSVISYLFCRKVYFIPFEFGRIAMIAIVCLLLYFCFRILSNDSFWFNLLLKLIVSFLVFPILYWLHFFNSEELGYIFNYFYKFKKILSN